MISTLNFILLFAYLVHVPFNRDDIKLAMVQAASLTSGKAGVDYNQFAGLELWWERLRAMF